MQSLANDDLRLQAQMLAESEERFRQLAENVSTVFWICEWPSRKIIYVNPYYETVFGKNCQSLLDNRESWVDSIHPEDVERFVAAQPKLATDTFDETYRIVRPDGKVRWIRDRANPVHDDDGKVYRIVGTALDVTEKSAAHNAGPPCHALAAPSIQQRQPKKPRNPSLTPPMSYSAGTLRRLICMTKKAASSHPSSPSTRSTANGPRADRLFTGLSLLSLPAGCSTTARD